MLSIIVPAYNEEQRLPATLDRMREYLDGHDEPYEVLVVDDGSTRLHAGDCARGSRRTGRSSRCSRCRTQHGQGRGRAPRHAHARKVSIASSATPISARRSRRSSVCERDCTGAAPSPSHRARFRSRDRRAPARAPRGDGSDVQPAAAGRRVARAARHAVRVQGVHRRSGDRLLRAVARRCASDSTPRSCFVPAARAGP